MSFEQPHIYRARLDFLYQSIAVYAAAIVVYLIGRSAIASEVFPSLWQDPLLLLLSAITLISVFALGYNLFMRRQIEITSNAIHFRSRALDRPYTRDEILYVQIGPRSGQPHGPIRVVRLRLKSKRRAVRVRLWNFEDRKRLLADLREWAGPLARDARPSPVVPIGKEPAR